MADNSSASGGVVKIELKDIDITETIGSGGFGEVKKGCYNRKTVAVKFLAPQGRQITKRDKRDFQKEAKRLNEASHHESILNIHGVVLDENTFALVLEYMHLGNVEDFIKDFNVGVPLRMRILEQIISVMDYLHSHNPPIKHLDLKAANVLINYLFIAKVCDFGLSEFKTKTVTEELGSNRRATHTHVAPEVLKDITMKASTAQDVYAFAITAWEIFTGEEVYKGKDKDTITQCVMRQQRPDLNCLVQECPDYVRNLINICWDQQPGRRPTFRGIKDTFGKLYAKDSPKLRTSCMDIRRQICEKHVCHPGEYEELFKCTEVWDRSSGEEMLRDSEPNTSPTVKPQENRPRLERELRLESEVRLEGEPILRGEPTAQTQLSSSAKSSQVTPDGNPESSLLTNVAGSVSQQSGLHVTSFGSQNISPNLATSHMPGRNRQLSPMRESTSDLSSEQATNPKLSRMVNYFRAITVDGNARKEGTADQANRHNPQDHGTQFHGNATLNQQSTSFRTAQNPQTREKHSSSANQNIPSFQTDIKPGQRSTTTGIVLHDRDACTQVLLTSDMGFSPNIQIGNNNNMVVYNNGDIKHRRKKKNGI